MKPLAVISSRCLFIRVFITKHATAVSICQESRQTEASSKARDFNEIYLLNKSVNDVMKKTEQTKRPPCFSQKEGILVPIAEPGPRYHSEEGREGAEPGLALAEGTQASLLELPLLATHGAVLLHLLRVQPLEDAVHVEAV